MQDFVVNFYKPSGWNSTQVGALFKKHWNIQKVGHLGTLDNLAEGLLPIFTGKYTKLIPYFQDSDKVYEAKIQFGASSETLDREGEITYSPVPKFTEQEIKKALKSFQGKILQEAPSYSALKYQGKPSYYYSRKNIAIPVKKRWISIFSLDFLSYRHPFLEVKIHCSKGCYIRSLARDIGNKLGTTAILYYLKRIKIGKKFDLNNTILLDKFIKKNQNKDFILKTWSLLDDYTSLFVCSLQLEHLIYGRKIKIEQKSIFFKENKSDAFAFLPEKKLVAAGLLQEQKGGMFFQPKKLFIDNYSEKIC